MNVLWIFYILVLFCIYILLGLHITEGIDSFVQIALTWVIYTIMWSTFINIFLLGYFWDVVRDKRGPTGLRGISGEKGPDGITGKCAIDLVEAYLIKELLSHINELYKSRSNQSILDETYYTVPCKYLNNKIAVMAGSRQYKVIYKNLYVDYNASLYDKADFSDTVLQTDTKPIISIINYLKSIWTVWFNLIYDATSAPGTWFLDEYGDEDYTWSGADPFTEIRKYDVYYWGLTRDFRPLKAEICRTSATYQSSKLPIPNNKLAPRLKIIQTNDYYKVGSHSASSGGILGVFTSGYNSSDDVSIWSPKSVTFDSETYHPIGDVITSGVTEHTTNKNKTTVVGDIKYNSGIDNGPSMKTILVAGDVVDPTSYVITQDLRTRDWTGLSKPVCPNGYTALGDAGSSKNHNRTNYKCLPNDCLTQVEKSPRGEYAYPKWNRYNRWFNFNIFSNFGWNTNWKDNVNTLQDWAATGIESTDASGSTGYNVARGGGSDPFYKIKDECLAVPTQPKAITTKEVESKYDDLGIGWYGHPYKLQPKYSIFSYLKLVPEGLIVHSGTGIRSYVVHYGGSEMNIYLVLVQDAAGTYTNALQIDANTNTNTDIVAISKKDTRQQWKIELQPNNKKQFTLKNIDNSGYLCLELDPENGNAIYTSKTTKDPGWENTLLFTFIPAFGTHLNNMDNDGYDYGR